MHMTLVFLETRHCSGLQVNREWLQISKPLMHMSMTSADNKETVNIHSTIHYITFSLSTAVKSGNKED